MKKIIILCTLFFLTGCNIKEDSKPVLYKFNVESYDYKLSSSLMFKKSNNYTNEDGTSQTGSLMIDIRDNNECYSTDKINYSNGASFSSVTTHCQWQSIDYGVAINLTYKNIYKTCSDCDEQTDTSDYNISGKYLEKGKYLVINNTLYENVEYTMLKEQEENIIYYDNANKSVYTEEGYPAFNTDLEYRKTHQIKLDEYKIIDKTEY